MSNQWTAEKAASALREIANDIFNHLRQSERQEMHEIADWLDTRQVRFETKEIDAPLPQTDDEALTWIPGTGRALYRTYRQQMSIEEALTKALEICAGQEQPQ